MGGVPVEKGAADDLLSARCSGLLQGQGQFPQLCRFEQGQKVAQM